MFGVSENDTNFIKIPKTFLKNFTQLPLLYSFLNCLLIIGIFIHTYIYIYIGMKNDINFIKIPRKIRKASLKITSLNFIVSCFRTERRFDAQTTERKGLFNILSKFREGREWKGIWKFERLSHGDPRYSMNSRRWKHLLFLNYSSRKSFLFLPSFASPRK